MSRRAEQRPTVIVLHAAAVLHYLDAPVLLQVDDLNVAFPVRKGILRRVVDHHRVVNSLR
jgi:ABC-type microcin C transport system duplicated ATPase subunit YejF